MREGAIGLGHPVSIFLFLYRRAAAIRRVDQLRRELFFHRFFTAVARRLNEPAHAERQTSLWSHLDRYLISRAADTTGANLDGGPGIFDGPFKDAQRVFLGPRFNQAQSAIENIFRDALLATAHDRVDELRNQLVAILRVWQYFSFSDFTFARHKILLGSFRAVFGATLSPFLNPDRIQRSANDVIANTGKILDPP